MSAGNKFVGILKAYPIAAICFVIILIGGVVIFLRGDKSLEMLAQETDMNSRIRTIDQNVKNTKGLKADAEELQLLVEQLESKLFNRDQRAVNINFFYALEDRLNVRISNIGQMPAGDSIYGAGGPRALKLHSIISYNISLTGTFYELLAFMHELHQMDRLIRVADYQISSTSRKGGVGTLEARLRVIVLAETE